MCYFFFLLSTVFNMIVMFNLLIAIISETFTNVNANAKFAAFQERANMVAENSYLISEQAKDDLCEDNCLLLVAQYKGEEVKEGDDALVIGLERVEKAVKDR